MSAEELIPPPGSDEAVNLGCTCPVLDNARGAGCAGTYFVAENCSVHAYGQDAGGDVPLAPRLAQRNAGGWTHSMCWDCWWDQYPPTIDDAGHVILPRWPTRTIHSLQQELCCFCGNRHRSGIFMRAHPASLVYCSGHHPEVP